MFSVVDAPLSPDGRHIAATLAVGCGAPPVYSVSTTGGPWRDLLESPAGFTSAQSLGWSLGGKIVGVFRAPDIPECGGDAPSGVYLVDPDTLSRLFIYATTNQVEFWKLPSR
jgi:hypothetical protein